MSGGELGFWAYWLALPWALLGLIWALAFAFSGTVLVPYAEVGGNGIPLVLMLTRIWMVAALLRVIYLVLRNFASHRRVA